MNYEKWTTKLSDEQTLLNKQYNNLNILIKPENTKMSNYKGFHSGMTKIKECAYNWSWLRLGYQGTQDITYDLPRGN